jgi:hypothetical protein
MYCLNKYSMRCFTEEVCLFFGDHGRCKEVRCKSWNSSSVNLQKPFRIVTTLLLDTIKCLKQYLKLHDTAYIEAWQLYFFVLLLSRIFFSHVPPTRSSSSHAPSIVFSPRPLKKRFVIAVHFLVQPTRKLW